MNTPTLAEKIVQALEKECGIVTNSQWTRQPETVIQSVIDAHQKEQDMKKEDSQHSTFEEKPSREYPDYDTLHAGRDYWKAQFHKIHDECDELRVALDAANEKLAEYRDEMRLAQDDLRNGWARCCALGDKIGGGGK